MDRPFAEHTAELQRDGYTIVHGVFDRGRAAALVDELGDLAARLGIGHGTNGFEGYSTVRIYNLLAHSAAFRSIPTEPAVLGLVHHVLDAECLISSLSSIAIGPGEVAQPIHADDQVMPLPKPHVATVCNSMWALTDFTEANGATRVVPGSHTADRDPEYHADHDSVPAEMPAGSVLVWHGSLWHGGGANHTTTTRVGIAMNYCAGWVRQQENQQLGIPLDVVRTFDRTLQKLCGFGVYRGLIGHIDQQTPAQRLFGDSSSRMLWDLDRQD